MLCPLLSMSLFLWATYQAWKRGLTIQNRDGFSFKKVRFAFMEGLKTPTLPDLVSWQQKKSSKSGKNFVKKYFLTYFGTNIEYEWLAHFSINLEEYLDYWSSKVNGFFHHYKFCQYFWFLQIISLHCWSQISNSVQKNRKPIIVS